MGTMEAARHSFTGLLIPGTLALITAFVSFITLVLIPIPMVRELAITASIDRAEVIAALEAGARGLVMKHAATDILIKAIRCVRRGEYWVDREILADWAQTRGTVVQQPQLTTRERQIVRLILAGSPNRDIAKNFHLSEGTVKRHLSNIYTKLGVANRLELALFAMQHDIE